MSEQLALEPAEKVPAPPLTSWDIQKMLAAKYPGDRYAVLFDVPDAVGTSQRGRVDAIICGLWGSSGRWVDAYEIKVSRSDWLRELKQVDKADRFVELVDAFWLVTSSPDIAKLEEIPAHWGWLAAVRGQLRVQKPPARQDRGPKLDRAFVLGLIRCARQRSEKDPAMAQARESEIKLLKEQHALEIERARKFASRDYATLKTMVDAFEAESGIALKDWRMQHCGKIVKQLNMLGYANEGLNHVPKRLREQAAELDRLKGDILKCLAAIESDAADADDETP